MNESAARKLAGFRALSIEYPELPAL